MPRANLIRKSFPKIRIVFPKGERFYQVDARRQGTNGRRETFKTKAEAEARAQQIEDEVGKLGVEGLSFPTELRVMALNCASQLAPLSKTLNDATQHYIAYLKERELVDQSRPVNALVDEWLEAKITSKRKPLSAPTVVELKIMGGKLKACFGDTKIRMIQKTQIEAYLDKQSISNQTRKNILVKWGQFFRWAIPAYTNVNPCADVEAYPTGREIRRYDAPKVQEMLILCEGSYPDLLAYLAICTFAGLRPSECERLTWDKISLDTKPPQIEVIKTTIAVKDYTRHVTIEDNLREWLQVCSRKSASIVLPNFRKRFDSFKMEFGFKLRGKNPNGQPFIPDGLRHTFASFWNAKYHNETRLAAEMGNSPAMIRNHYNKAVRGDEVAAFWEIVPKALADKRALERKKTRPRAQGDGASVRRARCPAL